MIQLVSLFSDLSHFHKYNEIDISIKYVTFQKLASYYGEGVMLDANVNTLNKQYLFEIN